MIVRLTWAEMQLAHFVAGQISNWNMQKGARPRFGCDETREWRDETDVVSCRGELAVAKAFNLFWTGSVGDYQAVDVGGIIEVRTITDRSRRLMIHEAKKDRPLLPFVLCYMDGRDAHLLGWLFANEAQAQPTWWQDPTGKNRHAFFVPAESLCQMDELQELVASRQLPIKEAA